MEGVTRTEGQWVCVSDKPSAGNAKISLFFGQVLQKNSFLDN